MGSSNPGIGPAVSDLQAEVSLTYEKAGGDITGVKVELTGPGLAMMGNMYIGVDYVIKRNNRL